MIANGEEVKIGVPFVDGSVIKAEVILTVVAKED